MTWVPIYLEFEKEGVRPRSRGKEPSQAKLSKLAVGFGPYLACLVDSC